MKPINTCAGLAVAAKCLLQSKLVQQSMKSSLDTLSKLGEQPLRDISDDTLQADMMSMNLTLQNTTDDFILSMQENRTRKIIITMKIYLNLANCMRYVRPLLVGAVSLGMVDLTMKHGLVPLSPLAFGCYGHVLVATGNIAEGCRFGRHHSCFDSYLIIEMIWLNHHILFSSTNLFTGRLALKLVENKLSSVHKSAVIGTVCHLILWASDPLQSIIEAHEIGRKVGQQSGDFLYSSVNWTINYDKLPCRC